MSVSRAWNGKHTLAAAGAVFALSSVGLGVTWTLAQGGAGVESADSEIEPVINVIGGTNEEAIQKVASTIADYARRVEEAEQRPVDSTTSEAEALARAAGYTAEIQRLHVILEKLCSQLPAGSDPIAECAAFG